MKKILLIMVLIAHTWSWGQSTSNNNVYLASKYLGFDASNGVNPLFFRTNNITRMRLNGEETHNYLGTGFPVDVKGHLGIGFNGYFQNNTPLTMLHLEGPTNVPMFNGGQLRAWMKTGLFARESSDFMYVGMKPVGTNRVDAAIAWGDDFGSPEGPDNLVFLFNTTQNNLPGPVNQLIGSSANGYEMMRMTASGPGNENGFPAGYIGIGPLFSDVNRPQNRMHINGESALPTFVQISNAPSPTIPGTGQAATDGLKLGIQNLNTIMGDRMFGYLQWQENTPFIVQTASTVAGASAATGERMRITSIGSLNNTAGGGYGGLTTPANLTRVAISSDGANAVKSPKSLLQIGYEYGTPLTSIQGYRKWMDLGMLASNNKDHVWIGLKPRDSVDTYVTASNDKLNAVVAWGTDRTATASTQVDNMQFIFTGHPFDANPESAPSTSYNGLEMMRMYPASVYNHPIYNGGGTVVGNQKSYGRVGIGDFTATGVNQEPTQKLDVVGNARLRYLPDSAYKADASVNKVVMVDSNGVLRWGPPAKGLDCWDANGNHINDFIEDINGDGLWNYLDCRGLQGLCWDANGDGVQDPSEDINSDGFWNTLDCQGDAGTACWDLDGDGLTDPLEDINGDALWNALDCQGNDGLTCWDLNGNGSFDSWTEDMNGNGIPDIGDCRGVQGPVGPQGPQGPAGITPGAHNGTSMSIINPTLIALGQDVSQGGSPGRLLSTRQIPMNDFNILFTNAQTTSNGAMNRIGIGTYTPQAKVDIMLDPAIPTVNPIGLKVTNNQIGSAGTSMGAAISVLGNNATNRGLSVVLNPGSSGTHGLGVSVDGAKPGSGQHIGISSYVNVTGLPAKADGLVASAGNARVNYGGSFGAAGIPGSHTNRAVQAQTSGSGFSENISVYAQTFGTGTTNYGIRTSVTAGTGIAYGIHSYVPTTTNPSNRAGYFVGDVQINGTLHTSDSMFKTNVNPLEGSLKQLAAVKPVSYFMKTDEFPTFGFNNKKQFGFIAQQLETVFPNLVYETVHPAEFDSLGNEISPAVPFKSLNYIGLIPVHTQAILELNKKVDAISLSDESIKTNVQNITGSLDKVLAMRGVSYDWDQTVHPELNLDSLNQVGFIAQEVQVIDPRLTFVADDSLLHVKYEKVVPILAEAIEELNGEVESKDSIINVLKTENSSQQNTIDDLNNRLTQLENCLSGILPYLCQLSHTAIQANTPAAQEEVRKNLNVTLSNRNAIVLDQNVPNPFAEQTVINFSIPETVKKAQIHFYDGNGRFMNSVEVVERGLGSVTVFGSDLSTGVYTYTLVADGQVVATKKMMKE